MCLLLLEAAILVCVVVDLVFLILWAAALMVLSDCVPEIAQEMGGQEVATQLLSPTCPAGSRPKMTPTKGTQ